MIEDASSTPGTLTDGALLQRVGSGRDQDAFDELFKRNERTLYNLAYQFTNHRQRAEDVVQDSAVRIWRSASTFREDGNARAWMLRIVARVSIARLSRMRTHRSLAELDQLPQGPETAPGTTDMAEGAEILALLREALQRLPLLERRMVVLHFCAGMTQQEVGEALGVPQRTVSNRLKGALASLRSGLLNANPAGTAALLVGERLGITILFQEPVPEGLRERVLERVSQLDGASPDGHPFRAGRTAQSGGLALVAASVAAVGMISGAVWFAAGPKSGAPHTSTPAPAEAPRVLPAPASPAGPGSERFLRHWDFNQPEQAKDFTPFGGSWHHLASGGPDGAGCMDTEGEVLMLKYDALRVIPALRVSIRFLLVPPITTDIYGVNVHRIDESCRMMAHFCNIGKPVLFYPNHHSWQEFQIFLSYTASDLWIEGRRIGIVMFDQQVHRDLAILFRGRYLIDDLTIQELGTDELPDLSPYRAALERIEPAKRVGIVPVPELKSARPPAPVCIDFQIHGAGAAYGE